MSKYKVLFCVKSQLTRGFLYYIIIVHSIYGKDKSLMKKVLSVLLSIIMIVSVFSSYTYADENTDRLPDDDSSIAFMDVNGCTVLGIFDKIATGEAVIQEDIIVMDRDIVLTEGVDYTVSYSNNIEVGTAEVIIKGIGNYTGEYRKDFQIVAPELGNVTGIQISDNTTGSFSVKWNKVENATGYVVSYYSGTFRKWMKLGDTTATSFNANDLSKGTVYKLRIRAFKKIGSKYYYGAFAYANTATKPEKVKTFTIKNITNAGYTLAWTRVQGATEYQVLKYDSSKGKYVGIARGPITSYKISGKSAGQKDKYAVRAIKNYDGVYYYGEFNKRSFVTRPQKVATVKTTVDRGTLKISWSKVSNAEGYLVYYSTQKNGAYTRLAQIKGNKTFSYTTTKLAGKRVYIKVKAYRMADSTIIGGTASNAKYAKVFNNKTYNEIINSYINSYTIKGVNAQGYTISSAKRWELYNALTYIGETASFAMLDLDSGVFIGYNAKSYLPTASTVKMPYMLYALKQMEDGYPTLDTMLTYQSWDYSSGTSEIVKYQYGTKFSMRQVIHYICAYSDNCGYYMLQDYFGYSGYNQYIASLGCRTSVSSSVRWGVVSAADSTREWIEMYDYLYNGKYGSFMRDELKKSLASNFRIGLGWKYNVYSKCGFTEDYHHDTAVVEAEHPYVLVCLTDEVSAYRLQRVARAADAIHDEMWRYFDGK